MSCVLPIPQQIDHLLCCSPKSELTFGVCLIIANVVFWWSAVNVCALFKTFFKTAAAFSLESIIGIAGS